MANIFREFSGKIIHFLGLLSIIIFAWNHWHAVSKIEAHKKIFRYYSFNVEWARCRLEQDGKVWYSIRDDLKVTHPSFFHRLFSWLVQHLPFPRPIFLDSIRSVPGRQRGRNFAVSINIVCPAHAMWNIFYDETVMVFKGNWQRLIWVFLRDFTSRINPASASAIW